MLTKDNSNLENKCACVKCGVNEIINKKNMFCKKCYDDDYNNRRTVRPSVSHVRKSYYFERRLLLTVNHKSKIKGVICDIDLDWIKERIKNGVCEITNIPFVNSYLSVNELKSKLPFFPKIHRVDKEKGYTKNNCKMVISVLRTKSVLFNVNY